MMMMNRKIGLAILLLAIAGGITAFQFCKTGADKKERPVSQLVDEENKPVDFSDFRGKVVLVNNWASWCRPCIAEMPSIQKLRKELNSEAIAFVIVSFDEDQDKAKNFMQKNGYDLEIYFPGKNYPYATSSIPVTFVLDREGNVVWKHEGMYDYDHGEFIRKLRTLME